MARLNKTEKLMQQAAKSKNTVEAQAFISLLEFFEKFDYLQNENNVEIIKYLYCCEHRRETFDNIARNFYLSVSSLEDSRKNYQMMYSYLCDIIKNNKNKAA